MKNELQNQIELSIEVDSSDIDQALELLSELFKSSFEVAHGFIDGISDLSELISFHVDSSAAPAGYVRVSLKPSNCFREFLVAVGAA